MAESSKAGAGAGWRIVWAIGTAVLVQGIVLAAATMPVLMGWFALANATTDRPLARAVAFSLAVAPSYAVFALLLMAASAASTRLLGWKSPPDAEMPLKGVGWPLLGWVQYMVAIHVGRFFAGLFVKGSPLWTAYLRLAGARL